MPYKIVKSGSKYKVMKKTGSSHVFGTHPSKKAAMKQIAAIHANEGEETKANESVSTFEQYVNNILSKLID